MNTTNDRIRQIDSARGTAMLFVFLAHFSLVYFQQNGHGELGDLFERIGMVATPTFMLISGAMLGYLHRTKKERFGHILNKLQNRGLFFLLVGHCVIALAHIPRAGGILNAFSIVYITDTIGICILIGPRLIGSWPGRVRFLAGTGVYLLGWTASQTWKAGTQLEGIIESILVGSVWVPGTAEHLYTFPVIPWFGVYLASTSLGEKLGTYQQQGALEKIRKLLRTVSVNMITGAVLLAVAWKIARVMALGPNPLIELSRTFSPFQKLPPGPVYVLFYGGIGVGVLYGLFLLPERQPWREYLDLTSLLGQTSFFVFVVQYYIYYLIIYCGHLGYTVYWPAYLLGSAAFIVFLADVWRSRGYNRFLTFRFERHDVSSAASNSPQ